MSRIRHSLPVQLNHIRRSVIATLRAINAAQQSGSDVPVLPAFSDNCNGLFVVAREHTNLKRPTFRLKRNPIANTELQHLGVSPHVPQESQPLDNPIEIIEAHAGSLPNAGVQYWRSGFVSSGRPASSGWYAHALQQKDRYSYN